MNHLRNHLEDSPMLTDPVSAYESPQKDDESPLESSGRFHNAD